VTLIAPATFITEFNIANVATLTSEFLTPATVAKIVDSKTDVVFVSNDRTEIETLTRAGVFVISMHGIMAEPNFSVLNNLPSQSSYALPYYAAIPKTNKQI
jgi:hypothetical protein